MKKSRVCLFFITLVCSSCLSSEQKHTVKSKTVYDFKVKELHRVDDVIWGMSFLNEKEMLYTLRKGKVYYLDIEKNKVVQIKHDLNIYYNGQGGLLDIKLHPDFKKNHWVYFTYSTEMVKNSYTTALSRAQLNLKTMTLSKFEQLFVAKPYFKTSHHFGSRIVFDDENNLFMSIGERGQRHLAQQLNKHNGKIIRLHDDGTVPTDNPFYKNNNALPEIWSYGHRNPQGLAWDKNTKTLWSNEHGPKGGDEINRVEKGKNYGWPVITYGREYHGPKIGEGTKKTGMEQPFYFYVPSIAPSSLMIYSGKIHPFFKGALFSSALKLEHLNVIVRPNTEDQEELRFFENKYGRIRDVVESPDGKIYFSTDTGTLYSF